MCRIRRKANLVVLSASAVLGMFAGGFHGVSTNVAFATDTRAQALFRNYCMDCHGPKLTGEKFDKTLLCPNVQGKSADDYRKAVEDGPDVMPAFRVSPSYVSDGNLLLSYDDFLLLTNHEATFRSTQP